MKYAGHSTTQQLIKLEIMVLVPMEETLDTVRDELIAVTNEVEDKNFTVMWAEGIMDYSYYEPTPTEDWDLA